MPPMSAGPRWPSTDRCSSSPTPAGAAPTTRSAALQDRAAEAHGAQVRFSTGPAELVERDDQVVARCREIDLEVDGLDRGDHRRGMGGVGRRPARRSPADHGDARAGCALRASGRAASGRASSTTGTIWCTASGRREKASRWAGTTPGPSFTATRGRSIWTDARVDVAVRYAGTVAAWRRTHSSVRRDMPVHHDAY